MMHAIALRGVQVMVFGLVSSIVERLGDLVHPHAASILSWLPQVWLESEGQGMLRMQVIHAHCTPCLFVTLHVCFDCPAEA